MTHEDPFSHARFSFLCGHYVECLTEYAARVDDLLNELAASHGEGDYGMFTVFIPDHHWSATIIHAYAAFEQKLNEACDIARSSLTLNLRYKEFAGQGVSRAKLFLESYAQVSLGVSTEQWRHVQALNKLRNVLVHGGFSKEHSDFKFLSSYAAETQSFRVSEAVLSLNSESVRFTLQKLGDPLRCIGDSILRLKK